MERGGWRDEYIERGGWMGDWSKGWVDGERGMEG